jgi:hypothetical protein
MVVCSNSVVIAQHKSSFETSEVPVYLSWAGRGKIDQSATPVKYFLQQTANEFSTELPRFVDAGSTVTYAALQFAFYMGADPVILIGVDHSFDKTGGSSEYERRSGPDVNHFDPNYFSSGTTWGLPNLSGSERDYLRALAAFHRSGRQILDATIDGKLEVYPKISIDEALARSRRPGG